jgi:hypothetical protein
MACHPDPQCLGFPALGKYTAVIIGENDYRRIPEIRTKYFFAGCIEGIGIR